mgnify:CR=1 FL=1
MAIWTTAPIASQATGAGVAETAETTFQAPSSAVELVAVKGHAFATQGDPAEPIFGVFKLKGQDWKHNPYEWFSEIGAPKVGAIDQVAYSFSPRWWPAHLPVRPSAQYSITYEPLSALANNGQYNIDLKWSTKKTGQAPILRLCSRESLSTAQLAVLSITGAKRVTSYGGGYTAETVAADDPSSARLALTSAGLDEIQTVSFNFNFIHTIEATTGVAYTALTVIEADIPVKAVGGDPLVFSSAITVDVALGTAGTYAYFIEYEPRAVMS